MFFFTSFLFVEENMIIQRLTEAVKSDIVSQIAQEVTLFLEKASLPAIGQNLIVY